VLRKHDEHFHVLCNTILPLIGFAQSGAPGYFQPEFRDASVLAAAFAEVGGFEVLRAKFLESYPTAELLADLSAVELEQVRYWRPQRIGDIVFNHWD
jgi:hypothetical protein